MSVRSFLTTSETSARDMVRLLWALKLPPPHWTCWSGSLSTAQQYPQSESAVLLPIKCPSTAFSIIAHVTVVPQQNHRVPRCIHSRTPTQQILSLSPSNTIDLSQALAGILTPTLGNSRKGESLAMIHWSVSFHPRLQVNRVPCSEWGPAAPSEPIQMGSVNCSWSDFGPETKIQ